MSRRDWYIVGLVVCIILYFLVFILTIVNYQTRMNNPYYKFHPISDIAVQRNTILILNPFWIGIIIFSVLLSKSKTPAHYPGSLSPTPKQKFKRKIGKYFWICLGIDALFGMGRAGSGGTWPSSELFIGIWVLAMIGLVVFGIWWIILQQKI